MLLWVLYFFSPAFAQTDSSAKSLDEVIITANRFPQKQNTTGKVVNIIPRSVIEKSSGLGLGELLNRQAGLMLVGANNTLGTNQDIYLRGAATWMGFRFMMLPRSPILSISTTFPWIILNALKYSKEPSQPSMDPMQLRGSSISLPENRKPNL
jgi:vitamin B12 transporter